MAKKKVTRAQCRYQRGRRQTIRKVRLRLNEMKLDLATQEHTYHLQEYTRAMLALRRDASTPEQRAGIERLYFRVTGKRLQDVLEQYIIETLEK